MESWQLAETNYAVIRNVQILWSLINSEHPLWPRIFWFTMKSYDVLFFSKTLYLSLSASTSTYSSSLTCFIWGNVNFNFAVCMYACCERTSELSISSMYAARMVQREGEEEND